MLTLPIKKKWFDMILSGEKKEEYRERNKHYFGLFRRYFGKYRTGEEGEWKRPEVAVQFRNGYSASSPSFIAVCTVDIGAGRPEWGAEPGKDYFRLQIKRIEKNQAESFTKGG